MSFKEKKYCLIKSVIAPELVEFIYSYFFMKRQVAKILYKYKYVYPFPFDVTFGHWTDEQVQNTYSHYADIAMETLLLKCLPVIEKHTELKLLPTYSYARIYKKGDILKRHKDKFSCEISSTLNLGGEPWPIYLDPSGKEGMEGIKIDLKPGDMLIYKGCELEHWREKFKGENHCQVFLHYNNAKTKGSKENLYDTRLQLGLPTFFKTKTPS